MASPDLRAIETIRNLLEKRFKDSAEVFPEFGVVKQIDVIRTSSAILNAVMGVGGFPKARVVEIFGPESTGKTTIALEGVVTAQREFPNLAALYLDYEHALDVSYAHHLGVNLDPNKFIVAQPDYFEQGEEIIKQFLVDDSMQPKNLLSLIVVDSAAAMTPRDELMGDSEDSTRIGLQAHLMARFLTKATKWITKGTRPPLVILNQTRTKIDIKNPRNTGETAAGGRALKFYTTIRLQLEATRGEGEEARSSNPAKGMDQVFTRHRVRATAVKNKVAPPWMRGTLVFDFGTGINNLVSVAELAENKLGIMSGAGFISYQRDSGQEFKCRGREAFVQALQEDPKFMEELEAKVLLAIRTEHAKSLGMTIKTGGKAKEIEAVEGTVILSSGGEDLLTEEAL